MPPKRAKAIKKAAKMICVVRSSEGMIIIVSMEKGGGGGGRRRKILYEGTGPSYKLSIRVKRKITPQKRESFSHNKEFFFLSPCSLFFSSFF